MKFSSPLFQRLLPWLVCMLAGWAWVPSASAQDRLVFKDNHVQDGKVVGMKVGTVLLAVPNSSGGAPGQLGFNLALLSRVDAAPPTAFTAGVAAYNAGEWDKALAALKPVADTFRGLPTAWAQGTAALLGDLYIEKNDVVRAEAAYNDYRKLYPTVGGNSLRFTLGQARIALARDNVAQAKTQLEGLTRLALKNAADASRADTAVYGQAFCAAGQIQEREGHLQAALEDYLRTTTVFYQDNAAAIRAQKGADALRAAHKELVAP